MRVLLDANGDLLHNLSPLSAVGASGSNDEWYGIDYMLQHMLQHTLQHMTRCNTCCNTLNACIQAATHDMLQHMPCCNT
jgi:hypothetical protein